MSHGVYEKVDRKNTRMVNLLEEYKVKFLETDKNAETLADKYVAENIVPIKYRTDGIHIAMATINDLDIIVSYNFNIL